MNEKRFVGVYPRMLAHNIDLAVTLPFFYLLSILIKDYLLLDLACVGLYFLYQLVLELTPWRGSIGKRVLKIRVSSLTDTPPAWKSVLIRNLGKFVSVACFFLGIVWINFDKQRRSWHDKMAGTVVIFTDF